MSILSERFQDSETPHVFLSYSHVDMIYAERLARDLRVWGIGVWWDQEEILVGESLNARIQEGISQSTWLAIILTPDSVKSDWVQRELNGALMRELV